MSTPTVDEDWRKRSFVPGESARRVFLVNDVDDEAAAIVAVGIPFGTPLSLDNRLRSTSPEAGQFHGPRCLEVTVNYVSSGVSSPLEANPLSQPAKYLWSKGTQTVPTDIDRKGNPIFNAAMQPLEGATEEITFKILNVTRNQSSFDVAQSINFEDTVNDANVTIPMAGTVEPGQLLCVSIEPTVEYDIRQRYVPVAYVFWLWRGRVKDADGLWDSWKHRLLNAGRTGWWSDGGTKKLGNFVNANGSPISEPVCLGTNGTPLRGGYKVEKRPGQWVDAVEPPTTLAANLIESTTNATFLKYHKRLAKPFSGLTLF